MPTEYTDEEIISAGPYGCVYVLASDYAALEAELAAVQRAKDALTEVYAEVCNELARVKAESLRVVKGAVTREHEYTQATMGVIDEMIGFKDIDADWYIAPDWKNYTPETFDREFMPVRLERWEDEG